MSEVLEIDGSQGEGGGQVLRTCLALAMVSGRPVRIDNLRAGRARPGLMRQHLVAVQAAGSLCGARVEGAALGSRCLSFAPGPVQPGERTFSIGSAGSATLVLQTVLPPLLLASGPSRIVVEGGTHNPLAPPFHFLSQTFLPLVARMGPRVSARLERWGFYPAGGGRVVLDVEPVPALAPLHLESRGEARVSAARAVLANLPAAIGEREVNVLRQRLGLDRHQARVEQVDSAGPGNVVMVEVDSGDHVEVFSACGERGLRAEEVAARAAAQVEAHLRSGAPVGEHLADQLLVPLALCGRGSFRTGRPSLHATTNLEVIRRFLEVPLACEPDGDGTWRVRAG